MNDYEKEIKDIYSDSISFSIGTIIDDFWRCIAKYWLLFLALIIVGAGIAIFAFEKLNTVSYEVNKIYGITKTGDTEQDTLMASYLGTSFYEAMTNGGCGNEIAKKMEYDSYNQLPVKITGAASSGVNMIQVQISGSNADLVQRASDLLDEIYPKYANKIVGTIDVEDLHLSSGTVTEKQKLDLTLLIIVGVMIGIFIDAIFIVISVLSENKVYSKKEIVEKYGECLAQFPVLTKKKRSTKRNCFDGDSQELRMFRDAMDAFCVKLRRKFYKDSIYLVTSSKKGEGKTSIVNEMANSFSKTEKKVAILQLDTESEFGEKGIIDLCEGKTTLNEVISETQKNIFVLKKGCQASEMDLDTLLINGNFKKILGTLKESVDYILIDAPAILENTDTLILEKYVDQIIYVVAQGYTTRKELKNGIESLTIADSPLAGTVMNYSEAGISGKERYGKYGYGRYSKYGYGQKK